LYTYTVDDPINKGDPRGLCSTEKGQVNGCDVNTDPGNLKGKELKQFDSQAKQIKKQIAKVGQEIQKKGSEELKQAWASIKTINISAEARSNENGEVAGNFSATDNKITLFHGSLSTSGGDPSITRAVQSDIITHEIIHAETWNRIAGDIRLGLPNPERQGSFTGALERDTERDARAFIYSTGLSEGNKISGGYLGKE
jgi:hypothetical protein